MNTLTIITTAVQPTAGVWEFLNEQMAQAKIALVAAAIIGAIVIILGTAWKTKALMPTVIAAVVGAALIFMAGGGLELFSGKIGETVAASSAQEFSTPGLIIDLGA